MATPRTHLARAAEKSPFHFDVLSWITEGKGEALQLKLFDEVGQIYEAQLAKMEFDALHQDPVALTERSGYFEEVMGKKTHHWHVAQVRGKGQIGHTNQYLTHWFYPYKGKFHGQMVKALLNFMGVGAQSHVLDPFCGSGTTLVECAYLGIPSTGVEINPALAVVSRIKCDSLRINSSEISDFLAATPAPKIYEYFHSKLLTPHWRLSFERLNTPAQDLIEEAWQRQLPSWVYRTPTDWRNFLLLAYLHALSDYTYLKGTPKEQTLLEFFERDLGEYCQTIRGTGLVVNKLGLRVTQPKVLFGDAMNLPLPDASVDGIITSPPYSIALDYVRNDQHLLDYLGIDTTELREKMIGVRGTREAKLRYYNADLGKSLEEMHRVLKPGAWAAIVLGDITVDGHRTNFCAKILEQGEHMGISDGWVIRRPILGGYARLRYEYVVMLRK